MTNSQDFSGSVVAVTGAASGMGAACARLFAERGANVALIDINDEGVHDVATDIGDNAFGYAGDIVDSGFCDATITSIVEGKGRIDVLVNAAGTIHRADSLGTTDADFARVMNVNVNGMFYLSRAVVPHMIEQGGGAIVNFGSIWGGVGSAGSTAYCVSKGAVHQLTRAMALDHVEQGIRVNAVAPGEVRTPMLSSQRDFTPTEEALQAMADATIPMKRLAEPEEIARVVVFLASDEASYMTGEIVHVDAGYTAR
jgi:NAD(P)-dependent dehydrogenase (short-subunit alcohol dehydrogenase family)